VTAELERPAIERDLIPADTRTGPSRIRSKPFESADVELEHVTIDRHRVFDTHHELRVQWRLDLTGLRHLGRLENHRKIERLDLRFHAIGHHLGGEPLNEIWCILVHAGRKADRTGGQGGHVRP